MNKILPFLQNRTQQYYLIDQAFLSNKKCIKTKGRQTLRNIRKKYASIMQGYSFLTKNKIKIAIEAEGSYKVGQIQIKSNIFIASFQSNQNQQQYTLILKDIAAKKQVSIQIKVSPQQSLKKFREREKIPSQYKFFIKNNEISEGSQIKYKIEDVLLKAKIITVVKKISNQQKQKQQKQKEEKKTKIQVQYKQKLTQLNDIKKYFQNKVTKKYNDLDAQNQSQKGQNSLEPEISNHQLNLKISQLGPPYQLINKLNSVYDTSKLLEYLQSLLTQKQKASREILSYINRQIKPFTKNLQENGHIVSSIYKRKILIHEKVKVVDFQTSIMTNYNEQTELKYFNSVLYNSQKHQDLLAKLKNAQLYNFKGGEVRAGGGLNSSTALVGTQSENINKEYGIALDLGGDTVSLSNSKEAKATKGVSSMESISQIFSAYCCSYIISWNQNDIKLKKRVIEQFDQIVNEVKARRAPPPVPSWKQWIYNKVEQKVYKQWWLKINVQQQKRKDEENKANDISNWINQQLQSFLNKYGQYVQTGKYYLGGYYRNTMNYTFTQGKNANELSSILNSQTQLSINGGMSINGWLLNGKAGMKRSKTNKSEQNEQQNLQVQNQGYSLTYSHESNTLQNVQNLKDWCDLMKQFPYDWKLIKIQDKSQVSLARLIRLNKNNSINKGKLQPQFIEIQQRMQGIIKRRSEQYQKFLIEQRQKQQKRIQELRMIQKSKQNMQLQIKQQNQMQQRYIQQRNMLRQIQLKNREYFLFKIYNIKQSKCYILTGNNLIKLNSYDNYIVKSDKNIPKNNVVVVQSIIKSASLKMNIGIMVSGLGCIQYRFQDNSICSLIKKQKDYSNRNNKKNKNQHRMTIEKSYFAEQTIVTQNPSMLNTSLLQTPKGENSYMSSSFTQKQSQTSGEASKDSEYNINIISIQNYMYQKDQIFEMIIDLSNLKLTFQFNKGQYIRQISIPPKFLISDVKVFYQILQEGGIIDIGKNLAKN